MPSLAVASGTNVEAKEPLAGAPASDTKTADPPLSVVIVDNGITPLLLLALLHSASQQLSLPALAIYLNERQWTTESNLAIYSASFAVSVAVPLFGNPLATMGLARYGPWTTLGLFQCLAVVGFALCALIDNKYIFVFGWSLVGSILCLRSVRQAAIVSLAPAAVRTRVFTVHSLCMPLGGVVGTLLTRLIVAFWPDDGDSWLTVQQICFLVSGCLLCVAQSVVLACRRRGSQAPPPQPARSSAATPERADNAVDIETVVVYTEQGHGASPRGFTRRVLAYFCAVFALGSFTANFCNVALQPLLVDKLDYSASGVADIYLGTMVLSVLPALLIMPLTRCLSDRMLMVIGGLIQAVGAVLLLAPPLSWWSVTLGFVLVSKAPFFFYGCGLSLFSKLLGRRCQGLPFGLLLSVMTAGNALGSLAGGTFVLEGSGNWWLTAFAVPAWLSLFLLICPMVPLDPSHPLVPRIAAVR